MSTRVAGGFHQLCLKSVGERWADARVKLTTDLGQYDGTVFPVGKSYELRLLDGRLAVFVSADGKIRRTLTVARGDRLHGVADDSEIDLGTVSLIDTPHQGAKSGVIPRLRGGHE